jgi:thiol-disulfide isomerase/thioredoxin
MKLHSVRTRIVACLAALALLAGCSKGGDDSYSVKSGTYPGHKKLLLKPSSPPPSPTLNPKDNGQAALEWVVINDVSNVAKTVKNELKQAAQDKKTLVVYVGATWCVPCQEFYKASLEPDFGRELSGIRLIKFDLDRHQTLLTRADYGSELIPLFVVPDAEGRGTDQRFYGTQYKGQEGAHDLKKRLLALTASP